MSNSTFSCNQVSRSPANSACCPIRNIVVTEGCIDLININALFTFWNSQNIYVTFTVTTDINNSANINSTAGSTLLTIVNNGVSLPPLIIPPGTSTTRAFKGLSAMSIAPNDVGATVSARLCYKIFQEITV